MMLQVYSMQDKKTLQYSTPMFLMADGQAIRSFADEINRQDKDSQLWNHPEDFDLFYLGSWDTEIGVFNCGVPKLLVAGSSVKVRS